MFGRPKTECQRRNERLGMRSGCVVAEDLLFEVQSHPFIPGGEQPTEDRTGVGQADAIQFTHRSEAIRRAGEHGFFSGKTVSKGQLLFAKGNGQLVTDFFGDTQADAVENCVARRRQDGSLTDDQEVCGRCFGDTTRFVEQQGGWFPEALGPDFDPRATSAAEAAAA